MKFSINYNAHPSAVSPGSRVWLEGSGRGGRLGTAAGGCAGEGRQHGMGNRAYSAVLEPWTLASTALSGAQGRQLLGSITRREPGMW